MSEVKGEVAKFLVTGVLAFVASSLYAEVRFSPRRNLQIVPVSATPHDLCVINRQELARYSKRGGDELLRSAVQTLRASPMEVVSAENFYPDLLKELMETRILGCSSSDSGKLTLFGAQTPVTIEAFAEIGEAKIYAVEQKCELRFGDLKFPVQIGTPQSALVRSRAVGKRDILILEKPTALTLFYSGESSSKAGGELDASFNSFVTSLERASADTTIRLVCEVIYGGQRISVGEDTDYILRGGRFLESRAGSWVHWPRWLKGAPVELPSKK